MPVLSGSGPAEAPSGGFRGSPSALPISSEAMTPSAAGTAGVTTTGERGTGPQSPTLAHLARLRPSPRWAPSVRPSCLRRSWGATAVGGTPVSTRDGGTSPGTLAASLYPRDRAASSHCSPQGNLEALGLGMSLRNWGWIPAPHGSRRPPGLPHHPLPTRSSPSPASDTLTYLGQPNPQVTSIKPWGKGDQ